MQVQYYHAQCGGEVADTGLHSRGKSLWRCSGCGFVGFAYRDSAYDDLPDEASPVHIDIDGEVVCFIQLLDTRDRFVRFQNEDF
jgi:hypothetical protein